MKISYREPDDLLDVINEQVLEQLNARRALTIPVDLPERGESQNFDRRLLFHFAVYEVPVSPATLSTSSARVIEASTLGRLEYSADIIRKIDEAASNLALRDEDEPPPTEYAINTAKDLIKKATPLLTGYHLPADVQPFSGSIRIAWTSSNRNVRLICNPSPATASYIYRERLAGQHSVSHASENASVPTLTKRLNWLRASV